jgi:hypothetical protein
MFYYDHKCDNANYNHEKREVRHRTIFDRKNNGKQQCPYDGTDRNVMRDSDQGKGYRRRD